VQIIFLNKVSVHLNWITICSQTSQLYVSNSIQLLLRTIKQNHPKPATFRCYNNKSCLCIHQLHSKLLKWNRCLNKGGLFIKDTKFNLTSQIKTTLSQGTPRTDGDWWSPRAHTDTQANFTRLASFIALTKSDTIQQVLFSIPAVPFKEPLPAYSRAYFRFQRNNAMSAMETIDGEPIDGHHFKSHFMYVRKRVICEWCRWNDKKLRSWMNFTASRSWRKYFFTIVCWVVDVVI
jgi:hypothetical protein